MAVYEFEILNPKKSNITYIKDRQTLLIKIKTHPYKYYLEVRDYNMETKEYDYYILFSATKIDENCKLITFDDYGRERIKVGSAIHKEIMNLLVDGRTLNLEYKGGNDRYDKYAIN